MSHGQIKIEAVTGLSSPAKTPQMPVFALIIVAAHGSVKACSKITALRLSRYFH
jgi:hypothetical protein